LSAGIASATTLGNPIGRILNLDIY
jgi:hypothetical protein